MRLFLLPVLPLVVTLAACAIPGPDASEDGASAIVNGTKTTDSPAVGYLATVIGKKSFGSFCTATLVAPNVVLTAAHCLDGEKEWLAKWGRTDLHFGVGQVADENLTRAASFAQHPSWKGFDPKKAEPGRHDVAYIVLEKPVKGVTPMETRRTKHKGGCLYAALGYGISKDGYQADSNEQVGEAEIGLRQSLDLCATSDLVDSAIEVTSPKGSTCQGDSGGPLLLRSGAAMLGVVSYGAATAKNPGCSAGRRTYYAALSENAAFVEQALAAGERAAPAPAPSASGSSSSDPAPAPTPSGSSSSAPAPPASASQTPTPPSHDPSPPVRTVPEFENDDPSEGARASSSSSSASSRSAAAPPAGCRAASVPAPVAFGPLASGLAAFALLLSRRRGRAARARLRA